MYWIQTNLMLVSIIGVIVAFLIAWVLIMEFGNGMYRVWDWNSQSWQAVGTAVTGVALGMFVFLSWRNQSKQTDILDKQQQILDQQHKTIYGGSLFAFQPVPKPAIKARTET